MLERSGADSLAIEGTVYEWYRKRGVLPRWVPGSADPLEPIGRPLTDAELSRAWLRDQVAPVVARLREWYSVQDLYAVLFRGAELHAPRPLQTEGGGIRSRNDGVTIARAAASVTESAKPTETE